MPRDILDLNLIVKWNLSNIHIDNEHNWEDLCIQVRNQQTNKHFQ